VHLYVLLSALLRLNEREVGVLVIFGDGLVVHRPVQLAELLLVGFDLEPDVLRPVRVLEVGI